MPLAKTECLILSCDTCGLDMESGDGFIPHYDNEGDASEMATDSGWTVWEGHYWCWRDGCVPSCTCDHWFGGHEYGEEPCEEEGCGCQKFQPKEAT